MNVQELEQMLNNRKRPLSTTDVEDSSSPTKKPALENRCFLTNCDFCKNGVSVLMKYEMRKQGWKQRLVIAFNSLEKSGVSKGGWHSLTAEIYPFLETHWHHLWSGLEKEMEANWRKKVQDCLTHNKDMFESGVTVLGKKGYWRMAVRDNLKGKSQNTAEKSPKSPISDNSPSSSPLSNTEQFSETKPVADLASILSSLQNKEKLVDENRENNGDKPESPTLLPRSSNSKGRRSLLTQEDIALLQTLVKPNSFKTPLVPVAPVSAPAVEQPKPQPQVQIQPQVSTQAQQINQFINPNITPRSVTIQTVPNTAPSVAPTQPVIQGVNPSLVNPTQALQNQQNPNEPQAWGCEFKNFLSRSGIRKRSIDVTHLVGKGGLSSLSKLQL